MSTNFDLYGRSAVNDSTYREVWLRITRIRAAVAVPELSDGTDTIIEITAPTFVAGDMIEMTHQDEPTSGVAYTPFSAEDGKVFIKIANTSGATVEAYSTVFYLFVKKLL